MDKDTLTLIGSIALCLSSPIIIIMFGLAGRSILRSKGYPGWAGFALGAVFGIIGLIIAFVLPEKSVFQAAPRIPAPPSGSYSFSDHSDSGNSNDDYLRGIEQVWKKQREEAEEREQRDNDAAARERYEEREAYRQEEWNDYYAQREQERVDRLYEEREERLQARYGWSDDE